MPKNNMLLDLLYRGTTTVQEFNWDMMTTTPILQLISVEEIEYIRKVITSAKYAGNTKFRLNTINKIMHNRGFTKLAGGTNRVVYTHPLAPNAVFKVAIDYVGIKDNPAEYYNQQFLKPYCTKVFECSSCGTIASFERVERLTTFEEFYSIAEDYYYLLSRKILGKYIMEDIGIDYFMNIGIRKGNHKFCGPVLLDFPYLYELDGKKLICDADLDDGTKCYGEIDYDDGFNKLICTKCGRRYSAHELAKAPENRSILIRSKGAAKMKFSLVTNTGKVVKTINTSEEREFLSRPAAKKQNKDKNVISSNGLIKVIRKPVQQKKVEQPHHMIENHNATHPTQQHHEEPKKNVVVKHITISTNSNKVNTESINTENSKKITVNLIHETREVPTKPEIVKMNPVVKHLDKVETVINSKDAVVKRVISVSLGQPTPASEVVNTDKHDSAVKVNLVTVEKKENKKSAPHNIIKTVGRPATFEQMEKDFSGKKNDSNVKKVVKYIGLKKENEEVSDPTKEEEIVEKNEIIDEIITTKSEEPVVEEIKEDLPVITEKEKEEPIVEETQSVLIPAIEFDNTEEEKVDEETEGLINDVLDYVIEEDEKLKESTIPDEEIVEEREEDLPEVDASTEENIETKGISETDDSFDEEEKFMVIFTSQDIDSSILKEKTFIAMPKDEDEIIYREEFMYPSEIDLDKYDVYIYMNDAFNKVDGYDPETGNWYCSIADNDEPYEEETVTTENKEISDELEDDSFLEALAASAAKPSVEQLMRQ